MDQLFTDLRENIEGYYDALVALLPKLIIAIFLVLIIVFVSIRLQKYLTAKLTAQMDDPLLARFLGRLVKIVGIILAVIIFLRTVGLSDIATGLFAGASFSAVLIGFAFKDIAENFLAGIILAFNRPFRLGDTVELDGSIGSVVTLNMRTTHIKSFDGKDVYIPNANVVKNPVINYTIDGFLRHEFVVGLDYGSNEDEAMQIIYHALDQIEGVLTDAKKPNVFISDLNTSTLDLTVQYWVDTFDNKQSAAKIKTQAISKSLSALEDAGFYLPGDVIEIKKYDKGHL